MKYFMPCGGQEVPQLSEILAPQCEFMSHANKQHHSLHEELKDVIVISDHSPPVWPKGIQEEKNISIKMQDVGLR